MLVKDKNFGEFVGRYQYVLEMAKEKPDFFAEQLYEFYVKMASAIVFYFLVSIVFPVLKVDFSPVSYQPVDKV